MNTANPRFPFAACLAAAIAAGLLAGCGNGAPEWSDEEARAIQALREIAFAQAIFQRANYLDTNRDGVGDFGTMKMLANPDGRRGVAPLVKPIYTTNRIGPYHLYMQVVPGEGAESPPYWECRAFTSNTSLRCFYVDTSAIVRYGDRRETVSAESPPVEGESTNA